MDHLKEGIGLRGYGQKDPLVEYKRESFDMFEGMMQKFQEDTARYLYLMQIISRGEGSTPEGGSSGPEQGGPSGTPVLGTGGSGNGGDGHPPPKGGATSVGGLEETFHRPKQRELQQAQKDGASG